MMCDVAAWVGGDRVADFLLVRGQFLARRTQQLIFGSKYCLRFDYQKQVVKNLTTFKVVRFLATWKNGTNWHHQLLFRLQICHFLP
jgi:hypothetical protein